MRPSFYTLIRKRTFVTTVRWQNNVAVSTYPPIDPNLVNRSFTDVVLHGGEFSSQPETKKAIVDTEGHFRTFGNLKHDVFQIRKFALEDLKLSKGDTITLLSPNHIDYFSVVHGFCSAGIVISPANPTYTAHEVEFQLKKSNSKALVTHSSCLEVALKTAKDVGLDKVIVIEDEEEEVSKSHGLTSVEDIRKRKNENSCSELPLSAFGKDLAVLPFSSGTTGLPKGVMLTHGNLAANLFQFDYCEGRFFKEDDVIISPLPQFHIYAFTVSLNHTLMRGKTLVTMKRFDLEKYCQAVEKYKCTRTHIVPPIVIQLSKSPIVAHHDMSSLKMALSAAAPLGSEVERAVSKALPNLVCKQAWGMSELSPIGTCVCDDGLKSGSGTAGAPVPSTEAKVVDINTREALPPNKDGELLIRGPQVMAGYLNEPNKTKECLDEDGWLSTGDIAKIDEEGFIYITDRLKELIKFKGFQVAPAELEGLLLTHPAILDAVVIPRPDEDAGEVPRAYCVLKPDYTITPRELIEWAAGETAHYKRLKGGVFFVDKIPKTTSGKILRREVVAMDRTKYPLK